jgi:hypothetical protein
MSAPGNEPYQLAERLNGADVEQLTMDVVQSIYQRAHLHHVLIVFRCLPSSRPSSMGDIFV